MRAIAILVAGVLAGSVAQGQSFRSDPLPVIPRLTLSAGFTHVHSNSPPGDCSCFGVNGGYLAGSIEVVHWLDVAAEYSHTQGNKIGPLGQNLTLDLFGVGPQVNWRTRRTIRFANFTIGVAHGSDSYFPSATTSTTTASSLGWSFGGGLDYRLNRRLALRIPEVEFQHSGFPNGATTNSQRHLVVKAGITAHIGNHLAR